MKNSSAKKSPKFDPRRVITLDQSQLAIYQTGKIDIVGPDGELITAIGNVIDEKVASLQREMAIDNFYLLEDLIRNCKSDGLEISSRSAIGLANAFWQAQKIIE